MPYHNFTIKSIDFSLKSLILYNETQRNNHRTTIFDLASPRQSFRCVSRGDCFLRIVMDCKDPQKAKAYQESDERKTYQKAYQKVYRQTEKFKECQKKYREKHKEKIKKYCQEYYNKRKDLILIKRKKRPQRTEQEKMEESIKAELSDRISRAVRTSLKGKKGGRRWKDLVGYTAEDLEKRLRKTLPNNFTWQDFLDGKLHIDHIIPIVAFNFNKATDIDFKRCWALSNLQLLPAEENIKKGAKIEKPFQANLAL